MNYRQEIDGLRALAVLCVVAYHFWPEHVPGGFVGVDVFFVISGFLISRIIFDELEKDCFSLRDFYFKRIRRIFPALLVVLISCGAFGWFALIPSENTQLGKHIAAAAIFGSNVLLWSESGYFDAASEKKPLLHLWSLGIEEQFYFIAPLIFAYIYRKRSAYLPFLGALAFLSFFINILLIREFPAAIFYLPFGRIFELLTGSMLAAYLRSRDCSCKKDHGFDKRKLASFVGFSLILFSVFGIKPNSQFPGYVVLLPVIGTLLLIFAGSNNAIGKYLLSRRPIVYVGLISYPLYLWHWPLLSIAVILNGGKVASEARFILIVVAVALACLTFEYIEKPIRKNKNKNKNTKTILMLCIAMTIIANLGLGTYFSRGITSFNLPRFYENLHTADLGSEAFYKKMQAQFYTCENLAFNARAPLYQEIPRCFQSKKNEPITAMIVGDSHAEALFPGLAIGLKNENVSYYVSGYAPIPKNEGFEVFFKEIQNSNSVKTVILAGYWITAMTHFVPNSSSLGMELYKSIELILRSGKKVYLIVDVPSFSFSIERCQYSRISFQKPQCSESRSIYENQKKIYMGEFRKLQSDNINFKILDVAGLFCNDNECSALHNDDILFRDSNHLNFNGSIYVGYWLSTFIK